METFHVASEWNSAIYFSWCLAQAFAQSVQLFWPLVTFSVASGDSLTDSDLQLLIETKRPNETFIYTIKVSTEVVRKVLSNTWMLPLPTWGGQKQIKIEI